MRLAPSDILYSQDSINNRWRAEYDSRHCNTNIGETLDDVCEGRCTVENIPTISVMEWGGKWITADNRRLWVFKHLERLGKCETVPVMEAYRIPNHKLTTVNEGTCVRVRRLPGGRWYLKQKEQYLVCAIDFGTSFSGSAYSFQQDYEKDPTKGYIRQWSSGSGSLCTGKTPTVALISPDGRTLVAFGYEAENKYKHLMKTKQHKKYYLFRQFKMTLYKKLGEGITRNIKLKDELGKQLPAMDVFAMSIKYLADDLKKYIHYKTNGLVDDRRIDWVLTVPAIWTDAAKQFMREAATKAGLSSDRLTLALEPEAASLLCRHLTSDNIIGEVELLRPKPGSKCLIVDAGGGTVDITLHQVETSVIREVKPACGADCGGNMVDKAFDKLMLDLVGEEVYTIFRTTKHDEFLNFQRKFELKKQGAGRSSSDKITVRMPSALMEIYFDETEEQLKDAIASSKYSKCITLVGDILKIDDNMFVWLFKKSITMAISMVKKILQNEDLRTIHAIYMVGGYSQSVILQKRIKEEYPTLNVVIPHDAATCVLKGALINGHNPRTISERVLKYTYGVRATEPFDPNVHPISNQITTSEGFYCECVFSIHAKKGQTVNIGTMQERQTYTASTIHQQSIPFTLYASDKKSPRFVDEPGCRKIGETRLVFEDPHAMKYPEATVCLTFSGTEIVVEAEEVATGKKITSNMNFLG